jgi:hypothetical protein
MGHDYVTWKLRRWGAFVARALGDDGYPTASPLTRIMTGGRITPGHRVLARDMPPDVWRMQYVINQLTERQRTALLVTYAAPVDKNGRLPTKAERAAACECSWDTLRRRVSRARARVRYLLDASQK